MFSDERGTPADIGMMEVSEGQIVFSSRHPSHPSIEGVIYDPHQFLGYYSRMGTYSYPRDRFSSILSGTTSATFGRQVNCPRKAALARFLLLLRGVCSRRVARPAGGEKVNM